jgi:hypothetical protein
MMKAVHISLLNREKSKFRDPFPDGRRYDIQLNLRDKLGDSDFLSPLLTKLSDKSGLRNIASFADSIVTDIASRLIIFYAAGESLVDCRARLQDDLPFLEQLKKNFLNQWGLLESGDDQAEMVFHGIRLHFVVSARRERFAFLAIAMMLEPDAGFLDSMVGLLDPHPNARRVEVDLLLHAFAPKQIRLLKAYGKPSTGSFGYDDQWRALMRALSADSAEGKQAGLTQYMANWGRLMKSRGWKPSRTYCTLDEKWRQVDANCKGDDLFIDFAFEAALAVCAWDLDDSGFRDHPYYPRDLVEYYRSHVRHKRDAWRAEGVGPGVVIAPPPPRKKADLAKSKLKGYARWLELACDGDKDAHEAVIEETGRLRSLKKEAGEALAALADNGQGVCADIKDDDTLEAQLDSLLEARELQGFDSSTVGGAGPGRCEALLKSAQAWLSQTNAGYRLCILDLGDDAWYGLMVREAFATEFDALGEALGLAK